MDYKKNYASFLWMGFNCLKATQLLQGDSLLFTIQFSVVPGTKLIDLRGLKAELTLEPPNGSEPGTPGLGIQSLNH